MLPPRAPRFVANGLVNRSADFARRTGAETGSPRDNGGDWMKHCSRKNRSFSRETDLTRRNEMASQWSVSMNVWYVN